MSKQLTLFDMMTGLTGIELTQAERQKQLEKFSIDHDYRLNKQQQLKDAALLLIISSDEVHAPKGWDKEQWDKMKAKPYKERLVMAAALLAAEVDRLNHTDEIHKT